MEAACSPASCVGTAWVRRVLLGDRGQDRVLALRPVRVLGGILRMFLKPPLIALVPELAVSDAEADSLEGDNDVSQPQAIELESSTIASG